MSNNREKTYQDKQNSLAAKLLKKVGKGILGWLKSNAVSLVIFAAIVVAIAVIVNFQGKETEEDRIEQYGYEGEKQTFVLENDKLKFEMDSATSMFTVTVKETGEVWYSGAKDPSTDSKAYPAKKLELQSTMMITYSNNKAVDITYDNNKYSIQNGLFDYEVKDDYIKVMYSIGDVEKEFIFPLVMSKERYDEYLSKLSGGDKNKFSLFYKTIDINKLSKADEKNKDELLARYPSMEEEVIVVFRDGQKQAAKQTLETIFESLGYTYDEYLEDKAKDMNAGSTDKPIYNVSMIYRLDGDDLVVEVPYDEIEYPSKNPIYKISVLPYFGTQNKTQSGFLFVPEGGGAIIDYNNGKTLQNGYYANIYGWDMAVSRTSLVHETRTYFNVFGATQNNSSYICIVEDNAPYAAVVADISGKLSDYNFVYAENTVLTRDTYEVAARANGTIYTYQQELPKGEKICQRYRFVNSNSYVDMANSYHDYLIEKNPGMFAMSTDTSAPVVIDVIGAVDKIKQVVGIPMSRPLELTNIKETEELVNELTKAGLDNMSVKLTGFINGGVQQKMLSSVKLVSDLGSSKQLKKMASNLEAQGINVYLDGITDYAIDSDWTDGFQSYSDSARFVNREKAGIYKYSTITFARRKGLGEYYLLKEHVQMEMIDNLTKATSKLGVGVSFQNVGYELSADYTRKNVVTRATTQKDQVAKLAEISKSQNIMVNMGNDYVLPYVNTITNMDLAGSEYTLLDRMVPFYEIAIHGMVEYTGKSLNLAQDQETLLLRSAEYGAGLSFTVMDETPFTLSNTIYYQYFGAEYDVSKEYIIETYTRYNNEMGHVFNQRMVGHECLSNDLTVTTYADGTKVYVNYSYNNDATVGGVTIPARDYKVVR